MPTDRGVPDGSGTAGSALPGSPPGPADARRAVDLAYTDPSAADRLARDLEAVRLETGVAAAVARARGMAATSLGQLPAAAGN